MVLIITYHCKQPTNTTGDDKLLTIQKLYKSWSIILAGT